MKFTNAHKMMNQSYDFLDLSQDPIRTLKLSVILQISRKRTWTKADDFILSWAGL